MNELDYLWEKIERYPDKPTSIIDIAYDAQLAYNLAIKKFTSEENEKKANIAKKKLNVLENMMQKTEFDISLIELNEWYKEIGQRSWRDKIKLNKKIINKTKIRRYFMALYNNIRYDLLDSVYNDLKIGDSGNLPDDLGVEM